MAALVITLISVADASAAVGTQFEVPIEYVYQGNTYTVNAKFEVISEVEKTCMPIGNSSKPCVNKQGMSEYDQRVVDLWASDMIVPEKVKGYTVTKIGDYAFYGIKHKITLRAMVRGIEHRGHAKGNAERRQIQECIVCSTRHAHARRGIPIL